MKRISKAPLPTESCGSAIGPIACSAGLVLVLVLLSGLTVLGGAWISYLQGGVVVWTEWRPLGAEERRVRALDSTYPAIRTLRDELPPDAVVLLPPPVLVMDRAPEEIPFLASASAVYNLAYPRVPVHWGEGAPRRDGVTAILVWEHWGLEALGSTEEPTPANRFGLHPWPEGRPVP